MKMKKNNLKKNNLKKNNNNNNDTSKGLIMNAVSKIYKQKENYSHIQTHVPSDLVPSRAVLLKLVSEMWDKQHLDGFKCLKTCNNLQFYQNNKDPRIMLVGVREADFTYLDDVLNIFIKTAMFRGRVTKIKRYKECLEDIIEFQTKYPADKYYYIGCGASIAGAICDEFLDLGYLHEAVTYNSVVEPKFMNRSDIKHRRIYVRGDICYLSSGQYAPNTKVYTLPLPLNKKTFINLIEESKYLYRIHTLNDKKSRSLPYLMKILLKEEKNRCDQVTK